MGGSDYGCCDARGLSLSIWAALAQVDRFLLFRFTFHCTFISFYWFRKHRWNFRQLSFVMWKPWRCIRKLWPLRERSWCWNGCNRQRCFSLRTEPSQFEKAAASYDWNAYQDVLRKDRAIPHTPVKAQCIRLGLLQFSQMSLRSDKATSISYAVTSVWACGLKALIILIGLGMLSFSTRALHGMCSVVGWSAQCKDSSESLNDPYEAHMIRQRCDFILCDYVCVCVCVCVCKCMCMCALVWVTLCVGLDYLLSRWKEATNNDMIWYDMIWNGTTCIAIFSRMSCLPSLLL